MDQEFDPRINQSQKRAWIISAGSTCPVEDNQDYSGL